MMVTAKNYDPDHNYNNSKYDILTEILKIFHSILTGIFFVAFCNASQLLMLQFIKRYISLNCKICNI